jgi:hypothetical protein
MINLLKYILFCFIILKITYEVSLEKLVSLSKNTTGEYITKIKEELRKINVSRKSAFTDVINRNIKMRTKDENSLFRANNIPCGFYNYLKPISKILR